MNKVESQGCICVTEWEIIRYGEICCFRYSTELSPAVKQRFRFPQWNLQLFDAVVALIRFLLCKNLMSVSL